MHGKQNGVNSQRLSGNEAVLTIMVHTQVQLQRKTSMEMKSAWRRIEDLMNNPPANHHAPCSIVYMYNYSVYRCIAISTLDCVYSLYRNLSNHSGMKLVPQYILCMHTLHDL